MSASAAIDAAFEHKWDDALALLRKAAAGDEHARGQLQALGDTHPEDLLEPPQKERINDQSAIFACRGFATPLICDWLIERTRDRLEPAYIKDFRTGERRVDQTRTATSTVIDCDVIAVIMRERAARATGAPASHHEPPTVINYEVGQKFDRHQAYVNPDEPASTVELLTVGQRVVTIITYLNDDFEGAATEDPLLGLSFKGGKGDALIFSNVLANGTPDANTLHAGLPPTAGRKWVLSQWIRNRPLATRW